MNDRKRAVRYGISFVILAVLLIILFIWNVNSGSIHLSVNEILNIIFKRQGDQTSYNIVWEIRLPRILAVTLESSKVQHRSTLEKSTRSAIRAKSR